MCEFLPSKQGAGQGAEGRAEAKVEAKGEVKAEGKEGTDGKEDVEGKEATNKAAEPPPFRYVKTDFTQHNIDF